MAEMRTRLPCPACLGTQLHRVTVRNRIATEQCRRCGGIWLEHGHVQGLRAAGPGAFWREARRMPEAVRMRCHDCHGLMDRDHDTCPGCGWKNRLGCPSCDSPMRVEEHGGIRVDVCRHCKGVWFDHHEVETIWGAAFARQARSPTARTPRASAAADGGDGVLVDVIFHAPELAYWAVRGAAETAASIPAAAAGSGQVASAAVETAGSLAAGAAEGVAEAAGAVFETVLGVVVEIFGGL
jgi:Zn-finger nucleic acid-binding protein